MTLVKATTMAVRTKSKFKVAMIPVKATTTAMRNQKKFSVLDDFKEMAAAAQKCRDSVWRKLLRKRWARRDAKVGAPSVEKMVRSATVKHSVDHCRVSEHNEEWVEEVRAHCERCQDEKEEPTLQHQRGRCDSC